MLVGFCGSFMAQWLMAALATHPGFESRSMLPDFCFYPFSTPDMV